MIKTCQQCGAVNGEPAGICCSCDAPLGHSGRAVVARRVITSTEDHLAVEPEWRREVSSRLHAYRTRRHGGAAADAQSALPFEAVSAPSMEDADTPPAFVPAAPAAQLPLRRRLRAERLEISIPKHEIASAGAEVYRPSAAHPGFGAAPDVLFPVASLAKRRGAAILDGAVLLFSYGGMLALFWALGGQIGFDRVDGVVTAATLALFYAQYFALFTVFGGSTPGMMIRRLRVVSFDGGVPTSRQMVWRSFGYMLSAGTCFLGFLWALWDEDHLCWQDRISQTYLTSIEKLTVRAQPPSAERESDMSR